MAHTTPIKRNRWGLRSPGPWLEVVRILALLVLVTLIWCQNYDRWTVPAWKAPVSYGGDAWWGMAAAKAFADGEIGIGNKSPASFGAPFRANWNDYPSIEEGVAAWWGLLARWFGIFAGSNLVLLAAHLLALLTFYFVCRRLNYSALFSAAGAVIFACSRFAFARGLQHLGLTYYWHIPLGLLVVWYCFERGPSRISKPRLWFCIAVAVLFGIQNIYYTGIFCQFLLAAIVYQVLVRRQWKRAAVPFGLICIMAGLFVVMNLDTFFYHFRYGPNAPVLIRTYAGLELYALKPIELFLPLVHRIAALQDWAQTTYFRQSYSIGEPGSAYLGIAGICALLLLFVTSVRSLIQNQFNKTPSHFWGVLWIFAFSVVGGINGIMGLFGFVFFRCTNRYSIVILALALLFAVRELTRLTRKWPAAWTPLVATAISAIACYDQTTGSPPWNFYAAGVQEDAYVAEQLGAKLPKRAMIFQLPVADFPEVAAIGEMTDYEHFRPYLQSKNLRFSYGSNKGRTRERWQAEAVSLGMPGLVPLLEKYGFSAVLINRAAYADNGNAQIEALRAAGRSTILVDAPRLVAVALDPSPRRLLPPDFDRHWYDLEGVGRETRRWSDGDATITLENNSSKGKPVRLTFHLETFKPRQLRITNARETLFQSALEPNSAVPVQLALLLPAGKTIFRFTTDVPGEPPGNGDGRKLAFNIVNFELTAD